MDENPYESPISSPPIETGSLLDDLRQLWTHRVVAGFFVTIGLTSLVVWTIIEGDWVAVVKFAIVLTLNAIGALYFWARTRPSEK